MSYIFVTKEDQKRQTELAEDHLREMLEHAKKQDAARKAHEANRCLACGRNDPLPPWLQ